MASRRFIFLAVLCANKPIDIPAKTIDVLSGHLNLGGTAPDGKVIGFANCPTAVDGR